MEGLVWVSLLLSLSSQCQCSNKPTITSSSHTLVTVKDTDRTQFDPSPRYLTAEVGRTVSLNCRLEAGGQVTWNVSSPLAQEITDTKLSILNTKFSDTGEYSCRSVDGKMTDKVHVYILDPIQAFVNPGTFIQANVPINSKSPTRVGCQPTDPRARISIFNHNQVDITGSLTENSLAWSPQTGLWLLGGRLVLHSGMFSCLLSRPGYNDTKQMVQINFIEPVYLIPPRITRLEPHQPVTGGDLVMACVAEVNRVQLVSRALDIKMRFPPSVVGRAEISPLKVRTGLTESRRKLERVLTVRGLAERDSGEYSCQLLGKFGTTSSVTSQEIKVVNPNEVFIGEFEFDHGNHLIKMPPGEKTAIWIFNVEARPLKNARYTLRDPRGSIIDHRSLEKYQIQNEGYQVKLVIKHVTLDDVGPYPFEVSVSDGMETKTRNETLILVLSQTPAVEIHTDGDYRQTNFQLKKTYNVRCVVRGYPVDETSLQMYHYPCGSFPKQNYCNENNKRLISSSKLTPEDGGTDPRYHFQFWSEAEVTIQGNMMVGCRVCSKEDTENCSKKNDQQFLVGESESGFEVVGLELDKTYYEGDDVNISCTVSKYHYSDILWNCSKFRKTDDSYDISPLKKKCDVPSLIEDSQHSFVRTLVLRNISSQDDGTFTCEAIKNNDKKKIPKSRELRVAAIIKPKVVTTNMNDTTIQLKKEQNFKFICNIFGQPRPNVSWYKDGAAVSQDDFIEISTHTLELKYIRSEDAGKYWCSASNRGGQIELFLSLEVLDSGPWKIVYGCIGGGVVFVLIIIILLWKICYYKDKIESLTKAEIDLFVNGDPDKINEQLDVHEQTDLLPYDKEYEFPVDRLKLGKLLGSGAFGRVLKAEASGILIHQPVTTVAVKMVKPQADITYIKALMAELKIMMHIGKHLNIVNLLGASTVGLARRELLVIVEYCRFGNIQKYLIHHRHKFINQVDPQTGVINFDIGKDLLAVTSSGDQIDFPTERERVETSAHYLNSLRSEAGSEEAGYLDMASPLTTRPGHQFSFKRASVRYTKEPYLESDQEAAPLTTDCTVETELTSLATTRTYSVGSRAQSTLGPGWRSNMRGDYNARDASPVCSKDLLCWAYQVARGMEYLASKKVMHGDLACRNILLAQDNVVKICDFGLAKDIMKTNNYHKTSDGPLPVKWLAIECLRDRIFSTQSDVWAFGVVLWEMFSLGKTPYPGIEPGQELYDKLSANYRMSRPEFSPNNVYRLMLDCWAAEPKHRPRFRELADILGDLLGEGEREHYIRLQDQLSEGLRSDLLDRMAPPDYESMTGLRVGEDGYLAPDINTENGYLVPDSVKSDDNRNNINMTETLPSGVKLNFTKC